jgi:hypothetical protein
MGPEAKFYQQIKRNFKQLSLIRIENSSLLGTPDLLVCNTSAKTLGPLPPKTSPISMYRGSRISELAACGLSLTLVTLVGTLVAWRLKLEVGSKA